MGKLRRVPLKMWVILQRVGWWWKAAPTCAVAFGRDAIGRRRYRQLSVDELRATRRSDTVFVFGSGYSLNSITDAEWQAIARHDTVSFRGFPQQSFIRADYHLTGEVDFLDEYAARLRENPFYDKTVFVVQEGWPAYNGNNLIGRGLLRPGSRVFRYRRTARGRYAPPSRTFENGLVHGFGSAISVTNFAYLMGWRTIVLAGIDLYDKRYFWLPPTETRAYEKPGITVTSTFTGADDLVSMLGRWAELFARDGVQLFTYNPRSLLTRVLPIFQFGAAEMTSGSLLGGLTSR
jgi:hypothetical protein